MKKVNIIKNNRDFNRIIAKNQFVKNKLFVIYYDNNDLGIYRFGISVGKKIGNAVVRNYYKRITRNICDNHKNDYSNGKDYIIIIRKPCISQSFKELDEGFVYLIHKIEKEKENE